MRLVSRVSRLLGGKKEAGHAAITRWHAVHGDNVAVSGDTAARSAGFCRSVVFSDRPLAPGQKLWLRLASVSRDKGWRGGLRLGVTAQSPASWAEAGLPKYLCPDMTARGRTWARALPDKHCREGATVFLYLRPGTGELVWGLDGKEKGVLVAGVETSSPLWAVVDVYGVTSTIQLVDPRASLSSILSTKEATKGDTKGKGEQEPRKVIHNMDILRQRRQMAAASFSSSCTGQNISLDGTGRIATRLETEFCQGYVFLDSCLQPGEALVVRVLETEATYIGSLAFGLTTADPRSLSSQDLPEDSDLLAQRFPQEYWVHSKEVLADPQQGDELCFSLGLDGAVLCSVNGGPARLLLHSDLSLTTRPFLDLYGVAQKLEVVGVAPAVPRRQPSARTQNKTQRPQSCAPDTSTAECVVCLETEVDCVLYSCGHMCMCFQCAVQQWSQAGECPLCRAAIRDVIRTYRA